VKSLMDYAIGAVSANGYGTSCPTVRGCNFTNATPDTNFAPLDSMACKRCPGVSGVPGQFGNFLVQERVFGHVVECGLGFLCNPGHPGQTLENKGFFACPGLQNPKNQPRTVGQSLENKGFARCKRSVFRFNPGTEGKHALPGFSGLFVKVLLAPSNAFAVAFAFLELSAFAALTATANLPRSMKPQPHNDIMTQATNTKMGRKPKPTGDVFVQTNTRLHPWVRDQLEALAKAQGMTLSAYLRVMAEERVCYSQADARFCRRREQAASLDQGAWSQVAVR